MIGTEDMVAQLMAKAKAAAAHAGTAQDDEDAREALLAKNRNLELYDVPKRHRRALNALESTSAVERVDRWHGSGSWCLVLSGPPGCGKSVAAARWLWLCAPEYGIEAPGRVGESRYRKWYSAARLVSADRYGGATEEIISLPWLVIDDIGAEYSDAKGFFAEKLDYLLTEREADDRPTLLTTNLPAADFKARYSERIVDRIRSAGPEGGFVHIREASRRGAS